MIELLASVAGLGGAAFDFKLSQDGGARGDEGSEFVSVVGGVWVDVGSGS